MISVLIPSRHRPAGLAAATASLAESASGGPRAVEYLIAADPDDPDTARIAHFTAPERWGYNQLHLYWNELARLASGEWLMLWNDDTLMRTRGWDQIIESHRPAILWPRLNHLPDGLQFPAWPRSWAGTLGYVSPCMHPDTYLQALGNHLGRLDHIPVEVFHDRPDVTGAAEDDTYRQGRKLLGPSGMIPGFDQNGEIRAVVAADAQRLRDARLWPTAAGTATARAASSGS